MAWQRMEVYCAGSLDSYTSTKQMSKYSVLHLAPPDGMRSHCHKRAEVAYD